ncbi:putative J domain-containing protein C17A3.05c [Cytospora mali]|uniref:J domain-containing protein C17A3.05c n=1 Tax=Cytospora mali TaxID=578113 RepID=A0A194VFP0_CYTMA|nr:putative J domain-containing protein C17A3.05c [Valsa mali var. pyri (nom. inval.)]
MPSSATASGADAPNGSSARNRDHNQGNQERKYTVEQKAAVLRIRRCKPTEFYDILGLETVKTTCTEADIKKAYRKQSLLTHPDKNGHEHADEAFKMVARAFSVLGDKEKREKFDKFGGDPDSRFNQAQAQNPFSGFAARNAGGGGGMGGGMWEDELSPEEMFQRFFGGGGGFGGPFGGPQFVFNFGGPGIRVHQFGGGRPRRRPRDNPQQAPDNSLFNTLMGLLPIIFLFLFPLLSSLFSGGSSTPSGPRMVFDFPEYPYVHERITPKLNVKYYVNPTDIKTYSKSQMARMDNNAEIGLVRHLRAECENEMLHKQRLYDEAQGWFKQDPAKMEVANRFETASCRRLDMLGVVR